MATSSISADYSAITTIGALGNPCSNTVDFFDCAHVDTAASAIDTYIENCKAINKLWGHETEISPEFSRLLLLGYVSAIESFLRSVFRSIINTDAKAQADAFGYLIPFGAFLYHSKSTVAESLLEGISFASEQAIKGAINKFLDHSNIPDEIKTMLEEFEKICQEMCEQVVETFEQARPHFEDAFKRTTLAGKGWEFTDVTQYLYACIQRGARKRLEERGLLRPAEKHRNGVDWTFWAEQPEQNGK